MSVTLADLHRIVPTRDSPHSFTSQPPDSAPRTNVTTEPHPVPMHDRRTQDRTVFMLDDHGFTIVEVT